MKAMVMSQRLLCASLLIFFFFVMAAMAAENPQAKPTDVGDLDLGMEAVDQDGGHKAAGGKTEWPELVGLNGFVAANKIWVEAPFVHVVVIPFRRHPRPSHPAYDPRRVRVYVNVGGVVVGVPRIG